ncbi:MAG: FAD/NAD(P)-binding protein [Deltaproteobacteria bacterium]|nr:FAD/NAD(P)-binding protein [Deltaproteobacteria bacterium]
MTMPGAFEPSPVANYLPTTAIIEEAENFTARDRYFRLSLERPLGHRPGQFVMVSVFGLGEAPISISNPPGDAPTLEMVIRNAGSLTQVLHSYGPGDAIGLRGPYGHGFDLHDFLGRDVLFICGGLGLAPLRSLIRAVIDRRGEFGRVMVISGCRTPAEEIYRPDLTAWAERGDVDIVRLVDNAANMPWKGRVGLVTEPIAGLKLDPAETVVAMCGPPVMYKFVLLELAGAGINGDRVFVDLERRMRCGVGKCGHCQINDIYCCQDGPVFRFSEIAHLKEAFL